LLGLRDQFPSLVTLAAARDTHVSDYLEHSPLIVWTSVFIHTAFPEDNGVSQFFAMLDTASMTASSLEIVRRSLTSIGKFIVTSYFFHLSSALDIT